MLRVRAEGADGGWLVVHLSEEALDLTVAAAASPEVNVEPRLASETHTGFH
uniref:Uncharacterized protein n=1 Tax=Arundo donax TaxID=35708 RepID=A0A0A8XZV5_ARUDO